MKISRARQRMSDVPRLEPNMFIKLAHDEKKLVENFPQPFSNEGKSLNMKKNLEHGKKKVRDRRRSTQISFIKTNKFSMDVGRLKNKKNQQKYPIGQHIPLLKRNTLKLNA